MTKPPGVDRLFKPSLGADERREVSEVLDREWLGLGPAVAQFEGQWSSRLGTEDAVAVNSCTSALHLAVDSSCLPAGSKVLVPALTFASTALAALYAGLQPVFVDSDARTLSVSVNTLNEKYSPDVSALIVTHYAGHPAPMEEIIEWARERNLTVIEDCAHTIGTEYRGIPLGLWGDFGCFSFEEKKIMTTGDGGLVVSRHAEKLETVRLKRWLGIDRDSWKMAPQYSDGSSANAHWYYEISVRGFKYNMNDLAASVGLGQLRRLDQMLARRRELIAQYCEHIGRIQGVELLVPFEPETYDYQMFGIRVDNRDDVMTRLKSKGIATGSHYTPLTQQPLFEESVGSCPVVENEAARLVTLPLHLGLDDAALDYVAESLQEAVG